MLNSTAALPNDIKGSFVTLEGEKYYQIEHVDHMAPFFISVVSADDHWFFISSTGSLSAGRIRPENALFPYKSVDYIHESAENTGSKTILRVATETGVKLWEPFNSHHDGLYQLQRNLYKNTAGDKIIFEELNHDLGLSFKYQWCTSDQFGFIRRATLVNLSDNEQNVELIDGIQNLLPSGAPFGALQDRSALVDAYKWNERLTDSSLATFSLYAKLSDRAEPAECLRATTVFSLGEESENILLSSVQLGNFRRGGEIQAEPLCRGRRGAYLVHKHCKLAAQQQQSWQIVADIDQTHGDMIKLQAELKDTAALAAKVEASIAANNLDLLKLMAGSDACQKTAQDETTVHHYANVLFNNMRGGIVVDHYQVEKKDFIKTLTASNQAVAKAHQAFLAELPEKLAYNDLVELATAQNDAQLLRLCYEYLPLTFGRRHGDPSRPWNHFEIKLKDEQGDRLLSYQGNWRDIFQNWEALALSYPNFIKSFIAKFVNASTIDGYNPYRITKAGVDWEELDLEDPWSNIGYWGDHQIIYLLKFLELSKKFEPAQLNQLLSTPIFSYANVPYEIKDAAALFADPKNTVTYNEATHDAIGERTAELGSDGKLVMTKDGQVYLVNLTEKLLVPLLAKLGNLVVDGGIWLNTQRPEWNDANNAIVGNGLSMVTLYYMRRYVAFMQDLLKAQDGTEISAELVAWVQQTTTILNEAQAAVAAGDITEATRRSLLERLAEAASDYRLNVYQQGFSAKTPLSQAEIQELLAVSLSVIDQCIAANKREDGLYNAYNILGYNAEKARVNELYPMLEGQVAALSAGVLNSEQSIELLDKLFASEMFRDDQQSFMLYPDRDLARFDVKNQIPAELVTANPLLVAMLEKGDKRLVEQDLNGTYRFNPSFENSGFIKPVLEVLATEYSEFDAAVFSDVLDSYEAVFNHLAFTGRSGTMFGYEGLGCIYWHMVSKLLLAVQENYFAAFEANPESAETKRLAEYYYTVRSGLSFNKTPDNYGAFPTDPYSHTPKTNGAQQPGMTGQVKEEILTRFGELGLEVKEGLVAFKPSLLKAEEFLTEAAEFEFFNLDYAQTTIALEAGSLGFTYCQVPVVYVRSETATGSIKLRFNDASESTIEGLSLDSAMSRHLFNRDGVIEQITVSIPAASLMA